MKFTLVFLVLLTLVTIARAQSSTADIIPRQESGENDSIKTITTQPKDTDTSSTTKDFFYLSFNRQKGLIGDEPFGYKIRLGMGPKKAAFYYGYRRTSQTGSDQGFNTDKIVSDHVLGIIVFDDANSILTYYIDLESGWVLFHETAVEDAYHPGELDENSYQESIYLGLSLRLFKTFRVNAEVIGNVRNNALRDEISAFDLGFGVACSF